MSKQVFSKINGQIFTIRKESEYNFAFQKNEKCTKDKDFYVELTPVTKNYQETLFKKCAQLNILRKKAFDMEEKNNKYMDENFCWQCYAKIGKNGKCSNCN